MVFRKTIKEIIILVGTAVALAMIVNTFSPRGIALVGQWNIAKGVMTASPGAAAEGKPAEIESVAQARAVFDSGHVLFVDARTQENYEAGHIPGAVSLPVGRFDERIESFLNQYPPEQPIVTYCSGRTCADSQNLALLLTGAGYSRVRIFIDGFPGWQAEGYPIE